MLAVTPRGFAYLCALSLLGCGSDASTVPGGGPGGQLGTPDGGDAASGPGAGPGFSQGDGGEPLLGSNALPPTSTPFMKDATGDSGLDAGLIDELKQGGSSCSAKLLYPYEGTVMPGGLISPSMMWAGGSDASYVRARFDHNDLVEYEFATGASNPGEMRIPQADWDEITRRASGTPLRITHTVKSGGTLSTCETNIVIARGNMTGALFFNTYNHPDAGGQGAVMRMKLGQPESEIYLMYGGVSVPLTGPCVSCHSVSFDGSTVVATTHDYASKTWSTSKYDVEDTTNPTAQASQDNATFGALTPNGSHILTSGNPDCTGGADTFPRSSNNMPLIEGPDVVRFLDTTTGSEVETTGLQNDWYMWMSQFSPNGDRLVFNHAKPDGAGGTDRRELAMMQFDPATAAFTDLKVLVTDLGPEPSIDYSPATAFAGGILAGKDGCMDAVTLPIPGFPGDTAALTNGTCDGPCYPAWPFFTPDGRGVIFSLISQPDFAYAMPGRDEPSASELWYVDTTTLEAVKLDNANRGLATGEEWTNYYPTVLPVAVGGYYWVFWTSTRAWGHRDPNEGGGIALAPPGTPGFSQSYVDAVKKRIWVSAIRPKIEAQENAGGPLTDPSLPAFYLEGQGGTGNVRAFAALNPCVASGESCASGLDCCTGFCNIEDGAAAGTCVDEPPMCSALNEKCEVDADCCAPTEDDPDQTPRYCLGGFCGFISII